MSSSRRPLLSLDTRHIAEVSAGATTAFTGTTAQTLESLPRAAPQRSPRGSRRIPRESSPKTNPMIRFMFNGRATVRRAAIDLDSRLYAQANGGLNGQLVIVNRNSGVAAFATLTDLLFVE
jgi:hypothetical protein